MRSQHCQATGWLSQKEATIFSTPISLPCQACEDSFGLFTHISDIYGCLTQG